jgi:hypothetical protein
VVSRCTKKMLDLLGREVTLAEPAPCDNGWYLNLLWIERQKCPLLTHSGTLFSVFRAGVRVANLRPRGDYIVETIETELRAERLPADTFAQFAPDHVRIAKTASRSTLGYMKEMASELEWNIANDGGLDRIDIDELNRALRRQLRSRGRTTPDPSNSSTSTSPTSTDPRTPDTFTSPPRASPAADFLNPTVPHTSQLSICSNPTWANRTSKSAGYEASYAVLS